MIYQHIKSRIMRVIEWISTMVCALAVLGVMALAWWIEPREIVVVEERVQEVFVDREVDVYVVTATVYHAVEGQCDANPLVTASGAKIANAESAYEHRYLAVSRDLLDVFPYGTMVEVNGCDELDGVYTVADTLNKRYKGYIDLLINPDMNGGKWEGVRIKKVE
jgi:3D (Asp-Asp-Asp) domain-containing protein